MADRDYVETARVFVDSYKKGKNADILLPLSKDEAESILWLILKNNDPALGSLARKLEKLLQLQEWGPSLLDASVKVINVPAIKDERPFKANPDWIHNVGECPKRNRHIQRTTHSANGEILYCGCKCHRGELGYELTYEEYFHITNLCTFEEHPDGMHRHGLARYSKQAIKG